jgi:2-iminobutanoate/2-iminopropanoate deaminase
MYNSILTGLVLALSFSLDLGAQEITFVNSEAHLSKAYPFSEATIVNGIIYLSGEIGTLANGSVIPGGIVPETQQTLRNIDATLKRMGASL